MANRQHDQIEWVRTGDPATSIDTVNRYPGQLGGIYTDDQAKQWQYVQGDSTMTVPLFPGACTWWRNKAAFLITTSPTGRRGHFAGVVARVDKVGTELASGLWPAGCYLFIRKGGRAIVKGIDALTSAPDGSGKIVIPSATAGKVDVLAAGAAATYPSVGREQGWYNIAAVEFWVDLDNSDRED